MREIINSSMVQNILSNPNVLRTMFAENPQFQQVIQVRINGCIKTNLLFVIFYFFLLLTVFIISEYFIKL